MLGRAVGVVELTIILWSIEWDGVLGRAVGVVQLTIILWSIEGDVGSAECSRRATSMFEFTIIL